MTHFEGFLNPPPYYTDYPDSLQVLESRMNWVETKDGPWLYVTGILTNQSQLTWKDVELECRFFDASGAMVDAADGRSRFTVPPATDSAFRIVVTPVLRQDDYKTFKLKVSSARNIKSQF